MNIFRFAASLVISFVTINICYTMSIICKATTHDTSASNDAGVTSFVYAYPKTIPDNLPVAKKWCIEPSFMSTEYARQAETIHDLEVRPDDTWIFSFPKSGTTWTQEMVWLLANDLDYAAAQATSQNIRYHFVEQRVLNREKRAKSIENTIAAPSPRFIKSHLHAALLPKALWTVRPKMIYVARNPKDVAVSRYHFYANYKGWHGSFDDFMELVLKDELSYAPFHSHVISFWNMRDEENVLFLTYEEMKANLFDVLKRTSSFLNKSYADKELLELEQFLSFDKMKMNRAVNKMNSDNFR